jgi:hypothetical protein
MCASCGYQAVIDEIDDLICLPNYQWTLEPLERIYGLVATEKHVTSAQKLAIENIGIMSKGKK